MKVLILGGGGSRGCFQAGFLYETFDHIKYDQVHGTSVGALNSVLLAQCYHDNNKELLKDVWTNQIKKNSQIFKKRYYNLVFLGYPFSFAPLETLIDNNVNFSEIKEIDSLINISFTDLVVGKTYFASNHKASSEQIKRFLMSSINLCPAFKPIKVANRLLVDGSFRENVPLSQIIKKVKENDELTVVLCGPDKMKRWNGKDPNVIESAGRSVSILMDEITKNDIENMYRINSLLATMDKRQISRLKWLRKKKIVCCKAVFPNDYVTSGLLTFDQEELREGFEAGREKAKLYLDQIHLIDHS